MRIGVGGVEQGFDLGLAEGFRKALGGHRRVEQQRGILGDLAVGEQHAVIAPPGGEQPALAGRLGAAAELGQIGRELGRCGRGQALVARLQPGRKARKVAAVACERVAGEAVFQPQGVGEAVEFAAVMVLQPGLDRRRASAHSAPSKASSQRLTSSSQPSCALANPPSPLAAVTR